MADNLSDQYENAVLDWLNPAVSAPTRPTSPLTVALLSAAGSDSSAGTEVTGGSYTRQTLTLDTASGGVTTNTNEISFTGMPSVTVVAVAIYENGGGRIWHGPLAASKIVNVGDTFRIAAGDLSVALG